MLARWSALLSLAMGVVDRVHVPGLGAVSSFLWTTDVDSEVARVIDSIDIINSGVVQAIGQANLVELCGFPSRFCASRVSPSRFRETGTVQTYTDPRELVLPEATPDRFDVGYSVFFDDRPAFGKHSPRVEEETARWLALLHEIGIILTLFRAMKNCRLFNGETTLLCQHSGSMYIMEVELIKSIYSNTMNSRKELLPDATSVTRIRTHVRRTSADAKLSWGYHKLGAGNQTDSSSLETQVARQLSQLTRTG
ncbi:unnamed protein product [Rhizoctonia solani]|uniref:Secreted protein n=1 Tax=Rhizoctonia solani TaxID=456999 RepID=A0A8H3DEX9_9AGAM|nr:unnamed protein product [Rhizoctonia solani]